MGKGSKRRNENFQRVQANYADIDWKNTRRNKVQKMHGVEVKENDFTCQECHGTGRDPNYVELLKGRHLASCTHCAGTGKVSYETFRKQLGLEVESLARATREFLALNGDALLKASQT